MQPIQKWLRIKIYVCVYLHIYICIYIYTLHIHIYLHIYKWTEGIIKKMWQFLKVDESG